jgi:membrane protein DedA with SNARE-associated domain
MLESLLATYGYPILLIGTFMEGETVLVLGGIAAHLHYLSLDRVILCGFCGSLCGDQLYFYIGRRHGNVLLARRPHWQANAQRVLRKLERHQTLLILSFRFLYGLRTVTPFVIGMSDVSWSRFAILNVIGAAVWATCLGFAGFYFGKAVEAVIGDIKHYEVEVMGGVVVIAFVVWIAHTYWQRRTERTIP